MNCSIYYASKGIKDPTNYNGDTSNYHYWPESYRKGQRVFLYSDQTFCREILSSDLERLLRTIYYGNDEALSPNKFNLSIYPGEDLDLYSPEFDLENFSRMIKNLNLFHTRTFPEILPGSLGAVFDSLASTETDYWPNPIAISTYLLIANTDLRNIDYSDRKDGTQETIQTMLSYDFWNNGSGDVFEEKTTDLLMTAFYVYCLGCNCINAGYESYQYYWGGPGEYMLHNLADYFSTYESFVKQYSKEVSSFMDTHRGFLRRSVLILTKDILNRKPGENNSWNSED